MGIKRSYFVSCSFLTTLWLSSLESLLTECDEMVKKLSLPLMLAFNKYELPHYSSFPENQFKGSTYHNIFITVDKT